MGSICFSLCSFLFSLSELIFVAINELVEKKKNICLNLSIPLLFIFSFFIIIFIRLDDD